MGPRVVPLMCCCTSHRDWVEAGMPVVLGHAWWVVLGWGSGGAVSWEFVWLMSLLQEKGCLWPSCALALADRLLGSFLRLSPKYTFVLEDMAGPCGYAAGTLRAQSFLQQREHIWLPAMRLKYPRAPDSAAAQVRPCWVRGLGLGDVGGGEGA